MKILYPLVLMLLVNTGFLQAQTDKELLREAMELRHDKKVEQALAKVNKVLENDSLNVLAIDIKSTLYFGQKKYAESYQILTKGLKYHPGNSLLAAERGLLLAQFNEFDKAEADLALAEKNLDKIKDPELKCLALQKTGTLAGYLNHDKKAYKYLKQTLECDPQNFDALVNISAASFDLDKVDEGLEYLEKALKIYPDNFFILANIGFAYQEKGEFQKAIDYFNKALKVKPGEPQAIGNIAYNQYKLGKLDEALKNINKSIELYPQNSYSYRTRALIYWQMNKKQEACQDIETALKKGYSKLHGKAAQEFKDKHCKK